MIIFLLYWHTLLKSLFPFPLPEAHSFQDCPFYSLLRFSHFQGSSWSTGACFPLWSWYWKSWSVLSWCLGLKDCLEASPEQGWSQGFPKYGPGSSQATGTPGSTNDKRPTNTHYCWVCMPGPGSFAVSSPHPWHSTSLDNHRWHLDWRNLTGIMAHPWTPWPLSNL